jgi:hypothetical protein
MLRGGFFRLIIGKIIEVESRATCLIHARHDFFLRLDECKTN